MTSDGGNEASGGTPATGGTETTGGAPTAGTPATGGADGGGAPPTSAGAGGESNGNDCPAGMGDCDNLPGCEQPLTLPATCGSCTNTCSSANAFSVCENQKCKVESCNNNYADCNGKADDGCEEGLLNNNLHCGKCDRNCAILGATCQTNRCSTIAMVQNFGGGNDSAGNKGWAFSSDGLLRHGPTYDYTIYRFPLSGGPIQAVWSGIDSYVGWNSLLVQGSDVLWSQRGTPNVVMKKPITAAAADAPTYLFYPEYQPMFLRQVGAAYYWITGQHQGEPGYVYSRAVGAAEAEPGTRIVTVNQGRSPRAFAVTSNAIYWVPQDDGNAGTVDDDLRTTPLSGGTATSVPLVSVADAGPAITDKTYEPALQVVGDTIYFTHTVGTSAINGIYRYKTGDAKPTQIVAADNIMTFEVDENYVYYNRQNTAGVWRAPLTIAAAEQLSTGSITAIVGQDSQFIDAISSDCCQSDMYKVIK